MDYEEIIPFVALILCGLLLVVSLVVGVVYIPAALNAEAVCLERGYPKAAVTYNLKRYCLTLDGAVTVTVDSL